MKTLVLAKAVAKRYLIEIRRYAFDSLTGLLTIYLIFLLIFYGAKAFLEPAPGEEAKLSAVVVGYIVWILAIFSYSDSTQMLQNEAQMGTLEQLAMSPLGLPRVLLTHFFAGVLFSLAQILALLVVMMASTGKWLNLDLASVVPLLLLTITGVQGVGFVMGGLAIVYKRIQHAIQIVQFVFVAMIAAPVDRFEFVKYLPLSWGYQLIRRVMIEEASIFQMPGDVLFLFVHSIALIGGGILIFRWFETKARQQAKLAHY